MVANLILRTEQALPAHVRALLHDDPPPGVWHLPSHVRASNPFRFASTVSLIVLVGVVILCLSTVLTASRFRSEGIAITLGLVLFASGIHWWCRRGLAKSVRLEEDVKAGRIRYGLWITPQHVLVHDQEGVNCVARQDIARLYVYNSGRPPIDLLVLALHNKATVSVLVNALDGWAGQAARLQQEVQARLFAQLGITAQEVREIVAHYPPKPEAFWQMMRQLDALAQQLKLDAAGNAALCEMVDVALNAWPDESRVTSDSWFMLTEIDSSYEYGVNACSSGTAYLGFLAHPSWRLPLCRRVFFDQAQSIFPTVESVQKCAATFRAVPLTVIEFTGGINGPVFDAFLDWAATKPLKALVANDYSTDRNSVSNLYANQRKALEVFKAAHGLS